MNHKAEAYFTNTDKISYSLYTPVADAESRKFNWNKSSIKKEVVKLSLICIMAT